MSPEARSFEEKVRKASQLRSESTVHQVFENSLLIKLQECYKFGLEAALLHFRKKKKICRDKQRQKSNYFEVLGLQKTLIIKLAAEQSPSSSSPISPLPASGGSLINCSMPPPLHLHPLYVHLLDQLFTVSFLVDPQISRYIQSTLIPTHITSPITSVNSEMTPIVMVSRACLSSRIATLHSVSRRLCTKTTKYFKNIYLVAKTWSHNDFSPGESGSRSRKNGWLSLVN